MKRFTQWTLAVLTGVCLSISARADHLTSRYLFAAKLDGAQEVPAVTTNATGTASFFLNGTRDTLCIKATVTGLSGGITGAHIHEGAAGVSGGVVLDLVPYVNGGSISATITGAQLTPTFIAKMMKRLYYINIHTAANANGEIRGQILPESDWGIMVKMDGNQEVPAVATSAKGLGFFMLAQHQDRLSFNVVFNGLTGPVIMTHLHKGPVGVSGPIVKDLMPYLNGNRITGSFDTLSSILSLLMNDSLYINVHTAANPAGEVRGQLMMMPYLHYDAMMNGQQEVPAVATTATGVGVVRLNYTFDTLWYDIMVQGLSGGINAAHFHLAEAGVGGPVLLGFPGSSIVGNEVSGFFTAPLLVDSVIRHLNEGRLYVNVHTTANPTGEIRGQVYKTMREGYTYNLTGDQESTAVTTSAYGMGMASVDRDQTNVHYMMTVRNITPTAAHFHAGAPGVNGPVVHEIGSAFSNGSVYGYWRDTATANGFSQVSASLLRHDSMYVNFHTTANPAGEIRANLHRMLCSAFTLSIDDAPQVLLSTNIYPNPALGNTTMELDVKQAADVAIELRDVAGRVLWKADRRMPKGINKLVVPMSEYAAGIYMISVRSEEMQKTYKVIKK